MAKLLRFQSTAADDGKPTGLDVTLKGWLDQKDILSYGKNRKSIESVRTGGPARRGYEVLYRTGGRICDAVSTEYKEKKIISADSDELKLKKLDEQPSGESLDKKAVKKLSKWIKESLKDRVSEVETGELHQQSSMCNWRRRNGRASARRIMKMMQGPEDEMPISKVKFQINPRHPLFMGLTS